MANLICPHIRVSDLLKSPSFAINFNKYFNQQNRVVSFILSAYYLELDELRSIFRILSRHAGNNISFVDFYMKFFKNQTLQEFCMTILKMKKYEQFDDMIIRYLEEVLGLKLYDDFDEIYNDFLEELWRSYISHNIDKFMIYTQLVDCDTISGLYRVLDQYCL